MNLRSLLLSIACALLLAVGSTAQAADRATPLLDELEGALQGAASALEGDDTKDARKRLVRIPLVGATIPHEVEGRFGATKVYLGPARAGTGVTAGPAVRAMLEVAGVHDILTKTYGSCNPVNVVRATMDGLLQLRTQEQAANLRGVEL